jgi:cell division protein FtsN
MIQVGTFSVKANADEAAARLAAAGVPGEVRRSSRGGTDSWRVVAGAASPEEGADMLTRIRGLGFTDAYVITP